MRSKTSGCSEAARREELARPARDCLDATSVTASILACQISSLPTRAEVFDAIRLMTRSDEWAAIHNEMTPPKDMPQRSNWWTPAVVATSRMSSPRSRIVGPGPGH